MTSVSSGVGKSGYVNKNETLTKTIKKEVGEIKKDIQENKVLNKIVDSTKELVKTPEGKAIVGGLALTPLVPIIGPAITMGGIAAAALKKAFSSVKPHTEPKISNDTIKKVAADAAMIGAGVAAAAVVPVAGAVIAAAGAVKLATDSIKK